MSEAGAAPHCAAPAPRQVPTPASTRASASTRWAPSSAGACRATPARAARSTSTSACPTRVRTTPPAWTRSGSSSASACQVRGPPGPPGEAGVEGTGVGVQAQTALTPDPCPCPRRLRGRVLRGEQGRVCQQPLSAERPVPGQDQRVPVRVPPRCAAVPPAPTLPGAGEASARPGLPLRWGGVQARQGDWPLASPGVLAWGGETQGPETPSCRWGSPDPWGDWAEETPAWFPEGSRRGWRGRWPAGDLRAGKACGAPGGLSLPPEARSGEAHCGHPRV